MIIIANLYIFNDRFSLLKKKYIYISFQFKQFLHVVIYFKDDRIN